MKRRLPVLVLVSLLVLAMSASALAFDCIRVSSSHQGLVNSTRSGNWLLFDFSSPDAVNQTFQNVFEAPPLPGELAQCLADEYATSGQPLYFALGVGVAGGKKTSVTSHGTRSANDGFGVIAWNNKNIKVLSNGTGIDHFEDSGIIPALFAAGDACGIDLSGGGDS